MRLSLELEDVLADAIPDIAAAHAEMVAAALRPGEQPADIAVSLEDYLRVMALLRHHLVAADVDHLAGLDEEAQLCMERDRRTAAVSKTLSRIRRTCLGWFGRAGLEPLGLSDAVARGPAAVEQAREAVRCLRDTAQGDTARSDTKDPGGGEGSAASGSPSWLAMLAGEVEPDLRAVAALSEALENVRSETAPRAQRRKAAMASFDRHYLSIGRMAEAALRMSGKTEEADRIHPSTRKLARKE